MIFTDLLNHDFMICDNSSKSYLVGPIQPGLATHSDGWYPEGVYVVHVVFSIS